MELNWSLCIIFQRHTGECLKHPSDNPVSSINTAGPYQVFLDTVAYLRTIDALLISGFFKDKFQNKDLPNITSFQGPSKKLNKPITPEEVRKSLESLKNNRVPGKDEISGELLKYGTPTLHGSIANVLNRVFEEHESLKINSGELIALQKPGKSKGPPKNLRPITLLNTIRKALSIITLHRIRPCTEEYLSHSQSGFRPDRSTADVAWAHKWLAAKTKQEDDDIEIKGIDISSAFDAIDTQTLLDILREIIEEDELRIIRFLLSDTTINTRINGATKEKPFESNIGLPQGDSLSPVLFSIYLENALKEVRTILPRPTSDFEKNPANRNCICRRRQFYWTRVC